MGRRKDSLNKKTLERMGLDKYKINPQNDGKKVQNNPQNDGKSKRIRRTKAELIAAGYYNKDKTKVKTKEAKIQSKDVDRSHLFISGSLSADKISEQLILKAKEQGKENWEQDFRNDYEKGQKIYYIEINELCHTKELLELYVGTVYSKAIIAWVDRGEAHTIGIEDADKIFRDEKEARKYYNKVRVK